MQSAKHLYTKYQMCRKEKRKIIKTLRKKRSYIVEPSQKKVASRLASKQESSDTTAQIFKGNRR